MTSASTFAHHLIIRGRKYMVERLMEPPKHGTPASRDRLLPQSSGEQPCQRGIEFSPEPECFRSESHSELSRTGPSRSFRPSAPIFPRWNPAWNRLIKSGEELFHRDRHWGNPEPSAARLRQNNPLTAVPEHQRRQGKALQDGNAALS